ncbi:MAG: hypothetical protein ACI4T8_01095 [Christensenellales bacterium]
METNTKTDDTFAKFINKAKKKLNKKTEEPKKEEQKRIIADYTFIKSDRKQKHEALKKKVQEMHKKDPDAINPIMQLVDHSEYDNLTESQKLRYILTLSKEYAQILNSIEN